MLSWEYPPNNVGGLGKHVTDLVPALVSEDVEVHLLTPRFKGGEIVERNDNSYIYRIEPPIVEPGDFLSITWQTNLRLQEAAYNLIEKYGPFDLIHGHDWLVAFAGVSLKHHYKIPLVATIHATERGRGRGYLPGDLPRAINNQEWWLTYEAWRIICCSHYMSSQLSEYFDTPSDKIDIIPNGVSTARFDVLENLDLTAFRSNYAAPDERVIYFVGRVVEEKGVRVLIDSAPIVLASYPKCKFVIAGAGPQLQEFRDLAAARGLASHFYFTGFISDEDRDKLYRISDVVVIPSLYEPFGIVALEGMAAKKPVVVTDTGGMSEVVTNHQTGLKVYPGNPNSLAWGILHTLHNPGWSEARVKNAYQMVRDEFSWRRIARQTIETYEKVLKDYHNSDWGRERAAKELQVRGNGHQSSALNQATPLLDGQYKLITENR
jgi:glycosyltransferase involved in cell wall biosynthesis